MIKRLSLFLVSGFILLFSLAPASAFAIDCTKEQPKTPAEAIQCGTDNSAGVQGGSNPSTTLENTVGNIVELISVIVGIAAVIMIIIGGLRYITSGGNQDKVKGAKSTIMYALIGLIVVALSQLIVRFVLREATTATSQPACVSGEWDSGPNQGKKCP